MNSNGDAFLAFMEECIRFLDGKKSLDYYQESLPSPTDRRIGQMIDRFRAFSVGQRERFQMALTREKRSIFGIYGHREATLSVREQEGGRLLNALVGAVIANYVIPERRRVDVAMAVYHHCARELGVNVVDLFDGAAEYATVEFATTLEAFGRRQDVTLKKFGWRELKTPEGVKYTFSWG